MTNPWIKSNPYMSLWLSAANTAAAHQRAAFTAELARQQTVLANEWIRQWTDAWLAWLPSQRR
jgi:hypothetical protein